MKITSPPLTAKYSEPYSLRRTRLTGILLTMIMLFSILIVLIPKLGNHEVLVGADTLAYANWMENLRESESANEFLEFAFQAGEADRPLSLFFFYALTFSLDDRLVTSVDLLPVILSPSLTIVIFFATRELTRNDVFALFQTIILFSVLLLSIGIDVVKMILTESSGGIEQDMELAGRQDLLEQFALKWNNLIRASFSYIGGLLSNVIIFSLALYWAMTSRLHSVTPALLLIFLSLGILPVFVGDVVVQTRVLYNIPFQIPAVITLGVIILTPRYRVIITPLVTWLIANSLNLSMNLNGSIPQL